MVSTPLKKYYASNPNSRGSPPSFNRFDSPFVGSLTMLVFHGRSHFSSSKWRLWYGISTHLGSNLGTRRSERTQGRAVQALVTPQKKGEKIKVIPNFREIMGILFVYTNGIQELIKYGNNPGLIDPRLIFGEVTSKGTPKIVHKLWFKLVPFPINKTGWYES